MIGDTLPEYVFIRTCITTLRLVSPASIVYLVASAVQGRVLISPWIASFAGAEAAFFLMVYLPRKKRLQAPSKHPPKLLSRSQRQAIFTKCAASASSSHPNDPPYPTGWFLPRHSVPKREDVIDWLLWALFSTTREDGSVLGEHKEELESYIADIEGLLGKKLEEGSSEDVTGMRITVDPVVMIHRPLVWYFIVAIVDTFTSLSLLTLGFKHYSSPQWFQSFPPRPILSLFSQRAPPGVLIPYWYRPHRSKTHLPIVFIHGIGIGLYPYIPLLRSFIHPSSTNPSKDVGILLPELLPISFHMTPNPVPPREEMMASLDVILESLRAREERANNRKRTASEESQLLLGEQKHIGWDRVVLAAHSYGTFVAGWVVRECVDEENASQPAIVVASAASSTSAASSSTQSLTPTAISVNPKCQLSSKIARLVLIDPIPILLSHPAVAHNFVYRHPSTVLSLSPFEFPTAQDDDEERQRRTDGDVASQLSGSCCGARSSAPAWQLWYFASRDPDVARTLGRAFFWSEGGIWKEELEAFLSGGDRAGSVQSESNGTEAGTGVSIGNYGAGPGKDKLKAHTRKVAVVLAGRDQIVPAEVVRRYLTGEDVAQERWAGKIGEAVDRNVDEHRESEEPEVSVEATVESGCKDKHEGELEVLFFPEQNHATVFETRNRREQVLELLRRYVGETY